MTTPATTNRKPCEECPFRRGATTTGGAPPEVYVGQAMGPFLLPCHMSPEYSQDRRDPGHAQCAGAAIYRANIGRDSVMPKEFIRCEKDTEAVFASPAELIANHRHIPVELAERFLKDHTPIELMQRQFVAAGVQFVEREKINTR